MPTLPSWVGTPVHNWKPRLGGGIWYQSLSVLNGIAPAIKEYSRPVLIGLRGDFRDQGYRFDLNTFAPNAESFNWFTDRASQEDVMKILGNSAEYIWSMPTPDTYNADPYAPLPDGKRGFGYPFQRPAYYSALLQYLTGVATMMEAQYNSLPLVLDFFTDASCNTSNTVSESRVGGNWANLRARRGHPAPYVLQAVILGIEPYGEKQEAMQVNGRNSGEKYGIIAETFRVAIRARGGVNATIPLGLNIIGNYPMSDFSRPWFKPLMDKVKVSDFSYMDMHHHYHFGPPTNEENRIYPGMISATGWQENWNPRSSWDTDYTRFLWMYENIRVALAKIGEDPARWKYGCAEHGLSLTSQFIGNDMGAGIHYAIWLAELMRYNVDWDMNWVFGEQGWSHAQLQFKSGKLTRTPAHYVYRLAQEFYGMDYIASNYASPTNATGVDNGATYVSPDVMVRVFKAGDGNYHLFVVNKHATNATTLTGFENWNIVKWSQLKAKSFTSQNPIGDGWQPETVTIASIATGQPIIVGPISVNHIELALIAAPVPTPTPVPIGESLTNLKTIKLSFQDAAGVRTYDFNVSR